MPGFQLAPKKAAEGYTEGESYNMTMHEPSSRVVRWESNHKPPTSWKHSGISPGRVIEVQCADGGVTESPRPNT